MCWYRGIFKTFKVAGDTLRDIHNWVKDELIIQIKVFTCTCGTGTANKTDLFKSQLNGL